MAGGEGTFQVPTYPASQNVNCLPFSFAYGEGNTLLDRVSPSVPGTPTLTSKTTTQVVLSWTGSSDDVAVDHYTIYSGSTSIATATNTSATITGLTTATAYSFRVTAVDQHGNESAKSAALAVTTN